MFVVHVYYSKQHRSGLNFGGVPHSYSAIVRNDPGLVLMPPGFETSPVIGLQLVIHNGHTFDREPIQGPLGKFHLFLKNCYKPPVYSAKHSHSWSWIGVGLQVVG